MWLAQPRFFHNAASSTVERLAIFLLISGSGFAASVNLRASRSGALLKRDQLHGGGCQFVAHRPDDTEAVLTAAGSHVLFRGGDVVVVEKSPVRYLVSLADDGTCNEQAEQVCTVPQSHNSTAAATCDESMCLHGTNGDVLLSYLRSMAGGALTSRPPPARSVVVGLGSGALASWLAGAFPDGNVDAVDLSADVLAAAKCFGVQESANLHLIQDDGRHFLHKAATFAYDAIFLDAFDPSGSMPSCLATKEFFQLLAQRLSPEQGVLSVNMGAHDEPGPVLAALRKAFMHVAVGRAPHLTNHLALASQTPFTFPSTDGGAAEFLAPTSVMANLTRWAREAGYQADQVSSTNHWEETPHTDAIGHCADLAASS